MISMHELTNRIGIDDRRRGAKMLNVTHAPAYEPLAYTYARTYTRFSGRMPAADGH